jgi:hypothetical protein
VAVTLAAFAFVVATRGSEQPLGSLYGGPFLRGDGTVLGSGSYAPYVLDPDGNNIEVVTHHR